MSLFLPVNKKDMKDRGWDSLDFLIISGDAYVDHPSFGHAIIGRVLEDAGFRVGILAQPSWNSKNSYLRMGIPNLGVLIVPGVLDSMVNHYTAAGLKRKEDEYSPGGERGKRPDRAATVYSQKAKEFLGDIPVIIGGMEASLRRFAHYDYWSDSVMPSVLIESGADLLVYGSGEESILEIAGYLAQGIPVHKVRTVKGTCYSCDSTDGLPKDIKEAIDCGQSTKKTVILPAFERVLKDKRVYADAFRLQYQEQDPFWGRAIIQQHGKSFLVQNPPQPPQTTEMLDKVYKLPYTRKWHPMYDKKGGVPAIEEVKFSITGQRGCFGGCAFCSITFHQGRIVQGRSKEAILDEVRLLTEDPDFKGYIHDIGGPTANFRGPACSKQGKAGSCRDRDCLFPEPCKNLKVDHSEVMGILREARSIPGVKKVFVRSGIRYDYLIHDKNKSHMEELCKYHISGQLKVAPEHVSKDVLKLMKKPGLTVYDRFKVRYEQINQKLQLKQYLVPYFISGHPGSTLQDAVEMAVYLKRNRFVPKQVQQFYPTPGTLATCMYYTGLNPLTMEKVYVATSREEKAMQRALLQFSKPDKAFLVREALKKAGREDLIGFGSSCLVRPSESELRRQKPIARGATAGRKERPGKNTGKGSGRKSTTKFKDTARKKGNTNRKIK